MNKIIALSLILFSCEASVDIKFKASVKTESTHKNNAAERRKYQDNFEDFYFKNQKNLKIMDCGFHGRTIWRLERDKNTYEYFELRDSDFSMRSLGINTKLDCK